MSSPRPDLLSNPSSDFMTEWRPCVLIPTYDNPATIEAVVRGAREHAQDIIVVDDGSGEEARAVLEAIAEQGLATVIHREKNGGKGAAVKTGFAAAIARGFTHALQIDGDGQHDLGAIPRFLERSKRAPEAAIFGYPEYDESAPALRMRARKFTQLWVDLEVGEKGKIRDTMIGFRVYPLQAIHHLRVRGDRMDFDIEIAVRIAWAGVPIVNLPISVRYLSAEEGGRSHFQPFRDNFRFALLHSRLCTIASTRFCLRLLRLDRVFGRLFHRVFGSLLGRTLGEGS